MVGTEPLSLWAMFLIGLLGAGHCIGMCGGISAALGFGAQTGKTHLLLSYHAGRVSAYALAGCAIGAVGLWGREYLTLGPGLRLAAGIMLVLMGLYMAGWWRVLVRLEQAGGYFWRLIRPLGARLLPVRHFRQGYLLGFVWGGLPCGLVYSALVYAATAAEPLQSGAMMAAFGVGTTPAVLFSGAFSGRLKALLQKQGFRTGMACLLIGFGVWTLWNASQHLGMLAVQQGDMHQHQH